MGLEDPYSPIRYCISDIPSDVPFDFSGFTDHRTITNTDSVKGATEVCAGILYDKRAARSRRVWNRNRQFIINSGV